MLCKMSSWLANSMAIYCLACVYYIVATRKVGTPFNDSLSVTQREIKKKSSNIRRTIFYQGIIGSAILLLIIKPFESCD